MSYPYSSPHPGQGPTYGFNPYGGQPGQHGAPSVGGGPVVPSQQRSPYRSRGQQTRTGFTYAIGYVVLIWAVHIVNVVIFGGRLTYFGIHPLDPSSLPHILSSPILHANFEHLMSNTIPGAIFAFLIGYSGHRVFWEVTAFVVLVGGIGTWILGGLGTNHIGASMLVYGWLGYLLVRGFFNRSGSQIALAGVLGLMYSGFIWGVLPMQDGISWQAHLFGGLGGVAAGVLITSDDPPELQARKQSRKAEKQARRQAR